MLKLKRTAFNDLLNNKDDEEITQSNNITEPEELNMLKNMKLLLLLNSSILKKKRQSWQKWMKFTQSRNDLLTVSQVTMYKTLQRIMNSHELS